MLFPFCSRDIEDGQQLLSQLRFPPGADCTAVQDATDWKIGLVTSPEPAACSDGVLQSRQTEEMESKMPRTEIV